MVDLSPEVKEMPAINLLTIKTKFMKKSLLVLTLIFSSLVYSMMAQVPNGGFENLNYDSTISNWGSLVFICIIIDTNGVSHGDSIVFDGEFYAPTTDAHSGSTAIELRNAYDFTTNAGIPGRIISTPDSQFMGFSMQMVPIQYQPTSLSFYYKYFPVNNDSGSAIVQLYDSNFTQIGEAKFVMSGTISNYTLATTTINYSTAGDVAYYSLSFCTAYSSVQGTIQVSLGTRLLIDDVTLENTTSIKEINSGNELKIYPNPSKEKISFDVNKIGSYFTVKIFDSMGQVVFLSNDESKIDISKLAEGIYFLNVESAGHSFTQKFIRE